MMSKKKSKAAKVAKSAAAKPPAAVPWRRGFNPCPKCESVNTYCYSSEASNPVHYIKCRDCEYCFKAVDFPAQKHLDHIRAVEDLKNLRTELEGNAIVVSNAEQRFKLAGEEYHAAVRRHEQARLNLAAALKKKGNGS